MTICNDFKGVIGVAAQFSRVALDKFCTGYDDAIKRVRETVDLLGKYGVLDTPIQDIQKNKIKYPKELREFVSSFPGKQAPLVKGLRDYQKCTYRQICAHFTKHLLDIQTFFSSVGIETSYYQDFTSACGSSMSKTRDHTTPVEKFVTPTAETLYATVNILKTELLTLKKVEKKVGSVETALANIAETYDSFKSELADATTNSAIFTKRISDATVAAAKNAKKATELVEWASKCGDNDVALLKSNSTTLNEDFQKLTKVYNSVQCDDVLDSAKKIVKTIRKYEKETLNADVGISYEGAWRRFNGLINKQWNYVASVFLEESISENADYPKTLTEATNGILSSDKPSKNVSLKGILARANVLLQQVKKIRTEDQLANDDTAINKVMKLFCPLPTAPIELKQTDVDAVLDTIGKTKITTLPDADEVKTTLEKDITSKNLQIQCVFSIYDYCLELVRKANDVMKQAIENIPVKGKPEKDVGKTASKGKAAGKAGFNIVTKFTQIAAFSGPLLSLGSPLFPFVVGAALIALAAQGGQVVYQSIQNYKKGKNDAEKDVKKHDENTKKEIESGEKIKHAIKETEKKTTSPPNDLEEQKKDLEKKDKGLKETVGALKVANNDLREANIALRETNNLLKEKNNALTQEITELKKQIANLKKQPSTKNNTR